MIAKVLSKVRGRIRNPKTKFGKRVVGKVAKRVRKIAGKIRSRIRGSGSRESAQVQPEPAEQKPRVHIPTIATIGALAVGVPLALKFLMGENDE